MICSVHAARRVLAGGMLAAGRAVESRSHSWFRPGQAGCTENLAQAHCESRPRRGIVQDDIAPFPTADAFAVLEADLGRPVSAVFSSISPEPVAAASLGQVYRATLADGGAEVAVKVQRPHLLPTIALDIFILRNAAKALRRARRLNSNLPALIDDWASSIYREMSYRNELANADEFRSLFSHYYEASPPPTHTMRPAQGHWPQILPSSWSSPCL